MIRYLMLFIALSLLIAVQVYAAAEEELYSAGSPGGSASGQGESGGVQGQGRQSRVTGKSGVPGKSAGGEKGNANLPPRYLARSSSGLAETAIAVVSPENTRKQILRELGVGESLNAIVRHSIIAFTDDRVPVVAEVVEGAMAGWKLIGESFLEKNSKHIIVTFHTIAKGTAGYKTKALAVSAGGKQRLEGEYHSNEPWLIAGDFVSSVTAAYFDGLVPRSTNVFGQTSADTSVDSAFKRGISGGAMSSAERFREKIRRAPKWAEAVGPIRLRVVVLERAIEN